MSWFFLISAFGCLWACKKRRSFLTRARGTRFLANIFYESLETYFQVLVLFSAFFYGLNPIMPSHEMSMAPFFLIMAAYLLKLMRGSNDYTLWLSVALSFYYVELFEFVHFGHFLIHLLVSILSLSFICVVLLGLEKRLLFSKTPKGTQGLPLLFMNMVLIILGLWSFQGILF